MAVLLTAKELEKSFGPRTLFRGIDIAFDSTERTGLIGPNGSGKSTLLKIVAGIEPADAGEFVRKRQLRVGYLPQADVFEDGATVQSVLESAATDSHVDARTQSAILISKIGFDSPTQPAADLSGGWRKRLSIARELIRDPELLLLDEPTNHLDVPGILWLEKLLKSSPFAFVMISHDRYFLENVTNRMIELDAAYPDGYLSHDGNYSAFLEKKESFLAAQQSRQQSLAGAVRREIEWLSRGAKARTTKAKGRIQQANLMMSDLADLKRRNTVGDSAKIDFAASGRETRKLLVAKGIGKSMGDRTLFRDVDLVLSPGQCLGLLGPNGSGKSTLLKILAGELRPDAGSLKSAEQLRVVRFEQDRKTLDPKITLRRTLLPGGDSVMHRGSTMHITAWAKQFLFRSDQLDLPVGELSGGEQARVLIAQLMLLPADVLILDEPTNDLDINTMEVLEESLQDFPGALVLVTHDRYLLDRCCTELFALDGRGGAKPFVDLAQWQQWMESADKAERSPAAKPKSALVSPTRSANKRLSWKEQKELETIESDIAAAESALGTADTVVADPTIQADHKRLHAAYETLAAAKTKVEHLYERWTVLEAKQF